MVVVPPHSIKSFFIGLMINETAIMGEDEGRERGGGYNALDQIETTESPSTGPGRAATLSDEAPEAVGGGDEWVNAFLLTALNREGE